MKSNFFLTSLCIVLFSITVNSQITKGNWMVGGDISYSRFEVVYDELTSNYNTLFIRPSLGFFIKDKLALGSMINLQFIENGSNNYYFTPFVRYYFLKYDKMVNYFLEGNAGYGFGISKRDNSKFYLNNYGFKSGVAIFLNQSVSFEFSVDYSKTNNISQKNKTNLLKFGFGLQIHLEKK